MNNFFKIVFGSCLGVFLAGIVFFVVMGGIAGKIISDESKSVSVKPNSVLEIKLNTAIPERTGNVPTDPMAFDTEKVLGLHDMVKAIEYAKEDDNIKGIFINADLTIGGGLATKAMIRNALVDFKESGKFIIAYSKYYTQTVYYMASVADKIYLNPLGSLEFRGFSSQVTFYKNMLDKLGVDMQVFYAGKFKGATEPYRRTDLSEPNRLQIREYLNGLYEVFLDDISESRGVSKTELKNIANEYKIRQPEDGVTHKLIDVVGYHDQAVTDMKVRMGLEEDDKFNKVSLNKYSKKVKSDTDFSLKDKVAVVYAEGGISMGDSDPGSIGDDKYMKILRKIRKNDKIKAVVMRVNSGGGSALASENIWREIERIKEAGKPVVTSMGDVAASGGYYIACNSNRIFAEEATITGSIGVFSTIPNASKLMDEKLGITFDTVRTGKFSNGLSLVTPMSPEEKAIFQKSTEDMYDTFLTRVSDGRKMSKSAVNEIAQGRVWTGTKAKEIGLVDEIGGLEAAVDHAASLADIEKYRVKEYPIIKEPIQQFIDKFTKKDEAATNAFIQAEFKEFYPIYKQMKQVKEMSGIQARMPYTIEIK